MKCGLGNVLNVGIMSIFQKFVLLGQRHFMKAKMVRGIRFFVCVMEKTGMIAELLEAKK